MQTDVTHVIVLEGINDIGIARANPAPSVEDLIAGHEQHIARAHARGSKIYGATLTPFEGAGYSTHKTKRWATRSTSRRFVSAELERHQKRRRATPRRGSLHSPSRLAP